MVVVETLLTTKIHTGIKMRGVIYVQDSKNEKISGTHKVDGTYAAIARTCSDSCPLRADKLCYARLSYVGMVNKRLEKQSRNRSPLDLARSEARCIDESYSGGRIPDGRMLRLHISGDSRTVKGSRIINRAVGRWLQRGSNLMAWSYTHSWNKVQRKEWSHVSILGSIESVDQVEKVRKQGYAPALVVSEFVNDKVFTLLGCETKFIPCPAQTKENVSCSSCRLCMRADWLFKTNRAIAFAAHGVKRNELKKHLKVIQ